MDFIPDFVRASLLCFLGGWMSARTIDLICRGDSGWWVLLFAVISMIAVYYGFYMGAML